MHVSSAAEHVCSAFIWKTARMVVRKRRGVDETILLVVMVDDSEMVRTREYSAEMKMIERPILELACDQLSYHFTKISPSADAYPTSLSDRPIHRSDDQLHG